VSSPKRPDYLTHVVDERPLFATRGVCQSLRLECWKPLSIKLSDEFSEFDEKIQPKFKIYGAPTPVDLVQSAAAYGSASCCTSLWMCWMYINNTDNSSLEYNGPSRRPALEMPHRTSSISSIAKRVGGHDRLATVKIETTRQDDANRSKTQFQDPILFGTRVSTGTGTKDGNKSARKAGVARKLPQLIANSHTAYSYPSLSSQIIQDERAL
jgi:hypothetical protein